MTPKPTSAAEAVGSATASTTGSGLADLAMKFGMLPDNRARTGASTTQAPIHVVIVTPKDSIKTKPASKIPAAAPIVFAA